MRSKKPKEEVFYVAVTILMPWQGKCADDAANKAAAVIGHLVQDAADFHGTSCMNWGPIDTEMPLATK